MTRRLFSLVVTVAEARHLADFLDAVDRQTWRDFEVVAVDHSDDPAVAAALDAWAGGRPEVSVIEAPGAGVAAARNRGLASAQGRWVGFPRAQDKLPKAYLARLAAALDGVEADLVAARKKRWYTEDARSRQPDPLAGLFATTRVVDLGAEPTWFHTDLDTAFLPLDEVRAADLRFDERVSPNFGGGHFCARFLLTRPRPRVLAVREAVYSFRVRPASLPIDPTLRDPHRFSTVPQVGFRDLLLEASVAPGGIPGWLRSAILYELSLYLRRDQQVTRAPSVQAGPLADAFRATLAEITDLIGPAAADGLPFLTPEWVQVLFHGIPGKPFVSPEVVVDRYDPDQGVARLWFTWVGAEPAWEVRAATGTVEPETTKVRGVHYFGAPVLSKRICWVPVDGALSVHVDGRPVPLALGSNAPDAERRADVDAAGLHAALNPRPGDRLAWAERRRVWHARLPWVRRRYREAWILMDRPGAADDNGERLFEYLRAERPDLNAWFVIDADAADYARLRAAHGDRVIGYGSPPWFDLALNARCVVSSHITPAIINPPVLRRLRQQRWKVAFLQHGVVRDDVSRWFNRQAVDLIVASTDAELASFVDDGTNYELTAREARLVGLPRFDRLQRIAAEYPVAQQDLVLVTPTWRDDLTARVLDPGQSLVDGFLESDFARNWLGLLRDDGFRTAIAGAGKRIGFLPHPNLHRMLADLDLPGDIEVLSYTGQDVQRLIARAAFQITDYSSMAFNSAWIDRPVIYFQFDAAEYFSGANNSRPGYFDFRTDGFGPVTQTVTETVEAATRLLAGTPAEYAERIRATFTQRDGRCCERTTAAIEALFAPYPG